MKSNTMKQAGYLAFLTFVFSQPGFADEAQLLNMVQDLQSQMKEMQMTLAQQDNLIRRQGDEIRELKNRGAQVLMAPAGVESAQASAMTDKEFEERLGIVTGGANKWLKDLSFKGDMRLRYEAFQNTSGATTETDDRNRFRYRLRFGWEKKLPPDLAVGDFAVGFALASGAQEFGSQADNVSTNTTFDNNFNFKDIFVEKVYAKYSPKFLANLGPLTKTTIVGGKQDNPFERGSSDIIWDRDLKPEGVTEQFEFNFLDTPDFGLPVFFNAGQFVLDEDSTSSSSAGDAELYAFQLGLNPSFVTPFSEGAVKLLSAVSYYSFNDYATNSNATIGGTTIARGNPNTLGPAADLDTQDFEVLDIFNEIKFNVNGVPVAPFFDWAVNLDNALSEDSGLAGIGTGEEEAWALGIKFGGVKKKRDWEFSYAYKRIGANSVAGGFNDSDFGASGHSAKRGSVFKAAYGITDNLSLNFAAIFANNTNAGTGGVIDMEQRRFQADLVWKL